MERLAADIAAMQDEMRRLQEMVAETDQNRDLHEKLAAHTVAKAEVAEKKAEAAHDRLQYVMRVVAVALLFWTPLVAWLAIVFHETYISGCYPGEEIVIGDEPWYCSLLPDLGNHEGHR